MKIIFVCSGNTCRSPMAEGYLKSKLPFLDVESRGFISDGESVSENSVYVMLERDIDISSHFSKRFSANDFNADKIICMTSSHADALLNAGACKDKIYVLGNGISDPYGGDVQIYRKCRNEIFLEIDKLIESGFFSGFKIERLKENDIPSVVELEKVCFSEPWSQNAITESLNAGTHFFIAKTDDIVCGYIGVSVIAGEGYITNVAVFPQYRKMGIGTLLLKRVLALADEMPVEFISLEVRESNASAIRLYNKLGFLKVGKRKGFYRNPTEDAIIMTVVCRNAK